MVVGLPEAQDEEWLDSPVKRSLSFMNQYPAERLMMTPKPLPPKEPKRNLCGPGRNGNRRTSHHPSKGFRSAINRAVRLAPHAFGMTVHAAVVACSRRASSALAAEPFKADSHRRAASVSCRRSASSSSLIIATP